MRISRSLVCHDGFGCGQGLDERGDECGDECALNVPVCVRFDVGFLQGVWQRALTSGSQHPFLRVLTVRRWLLPPGASGIGA